MLAGTCGPTQDIGGSVPSRNAVTMSFMPSAWLLARGPYCPEKAALRQPAPAQEITQDPYPSPHASSGSARPAFVWEDGRAPYARGLKALAVA